MQNLNNINLIYIPATVTYFNNEHYAPALGILNFVFDFKFSIDFFDKSIKTILSVAFSTFAPPNIKICLSVIGKHAAPKLLCIPSPTLNFNSFHFLVLISNSSTLLKLCKILYIYYIILPYYHFIIHIHQIHKLYHLIKNQKILF